MRAGYVSLIFFLVFCGNCMFMTWSANNEDDQNFRPLKKGKSPWGKFLKLGTSGKEEDKRREDTKGKRPVVESNSPEAGTSTSGKLKEYSLWTNKQTQDMLRFFYNYRTIGAYKGPKALRDWKVITAAWSEKHGKIKENKLKMHVSYLRGKMSRAAWFFDEQHPQERDINWTEELNDDLMTIYFMTEEGDSSKHGERMHNMWVRSMLPGYQNVKAEYLFNRTKAMLYTVKKIIPSDMNSDETVAVKAKHPLLLSEDQRAYLKELYIKSQGIKKDRKQQIFDDAVAKYGELEAVGKMRLYYHARYLYDKDKRADELSDLREGKMKKGGSEEFIVNGRINWRPEQDELLLRLWKEAGKKVPRAGRLGWFYQQVVERFSEIGALTPIQVHDHLKYLKRRERRLQWATTANQETVQERHVPYHTFMDDQSIPSMSQGTHHHHDSIASTSYTPRPSRRQLDLNLGLTASSVGEKSPDYHEWIASTSSTPRQSHEQTDLESGLETLNFGGKSPDTNLGL